MKTTRLKRGRFASDSNRTTRLRMRALLWGFSWFMTLNLLLTACGEDEQSRSDAIANCTPKTAKCVAANAGVVCPDDGTAALAFTCGVSEKCEDGACIGNCTPGESECSTEAVSRVCASDGKWIPIACSTGQACNAGKCVPTASGNQLCEPGMVMCATNNAVKECDVNGTNWVVTACKAHELCTAGKCSVNEAAACTPGSALCADATTLYRCSATGSGYEKQACPSTAPCSEGACRGSVCNAGESKCADVTYADWTVRNESASFDGPRRKELYTCVDGVRWEITQCAGAGQCVHDYLDPTLQARYAADLKVWVATGRDENSFPTFSAPPGSSASCKAPECSLAQELVSAIGEPLAAPRVCGDPTDPNADATRSYSQCEGIAPFMSRRWTNYRCPGSATCAPNGDGGGSCSSTCAPNQVRCNAGRTGTEVCDEDGKWSAKDSCTGQKLCIDPTLVSGITCVDASCYHWFNFYEGTPPPTVGTCDAEGNLRPCLANGRLGAPAPCPNGICKTVPDTLQAGRCESQCTEGQELCGGNGSAQYKRCVSGRWTSRICDNNALCFQYTESMDGGQTRVICGGMCEPGTKRCANDGKIQTCTAQGQWAEASVCEFGACKHTTDGAFCVAECVPDQVWCESDGALGFKTCGATGRLGASQFCPGGTKCRISASNKHVGCVECVGAASGGNIATLGIADSKCPDATHISYCTDENRWGNASECLGGKVCAQITASAGSRAFCDEG